MSRSLDQSRPFRAGRHRAEAAPVITIPLAPTSPAAEAPNPTPAPTEPASVPLRRRRVRRPAFEVPPAPSSAPKVETASPATEVIAAVAPRRSAPENALRAVPAATRRSRTRRDAVENPAGSAPAAAPSNRPVTAFSPHIASAFSSDAQAVLRRAASVRVMGHRMAVVAGALAVVLAVGTASQATELPFFGKESSAQDAPDAARPKTGTLPASSNGQATPRPGPSTPSGTREAAPAQAAPGTEAGQAGADSNAAALPAVADLPMPVDAPTLAGIVAASPATVPPSPAPTVILEPPVMSSAAPAAPESSAVPAPPAPTTTAAPATSPAPTPVATLPPSPTAAAPAPADGTSEEAVDTRSYAGARLASYGWGADQMNALNLLWDTTTKWRPSQVDRGLSYIKERYGSPAKALEFRAANKWY